MMIECPYRSMRNDLPVCQVVADLMDQPLSSCRTNDSACEYCLQCRVAPQTPNVVVASLAIEVACINGDAQYLRSIRSRFEPYLTQSAQPMTTCVLRGLETRKVPCKPCQADSSTPVMMPVYRCPKHQECTLHNTGTFPKIQACATCEDRLEQYVSLEATPIPAAVLAAIPRRGGPRLDSVDVPRSIQ